MATNRNLLKEAIADAKTVKETAIANAKAALEESFGPFLREKLAAKLEEIEVAEDLSLTEMEKEEAYEAEEKKPMEEMGYEKEVEEEISLDELLAEISKEEELDETKKEEKLDEAKEAEGEEEEMSIEDMTEEDLKSFIEGVIKDMVAAGELEAAEGGEGEEMEMEMGAEEEMPEEGEEEMMEEEVNIDELLAELDETKSEEIEEVKKEEEMEKSKKMKVESATEMSADEYAEFCKKNPNFPACLSETKKMEKELQELRSELQEINLLNAKLLYTNKIFRNKSLTESQKVKVLAAFDKAKNKQEAQLIYETLLGSVANTAKSPIKESLGSASKALGSVAKPIIENDAFARMRELAGLKK